MGSAALLAWETARRARLDELYGAHKAVGGMGPGRRQATEQINWSLAMRLAGEFQGYMRDLHDEAVDVFLARLQTLTPAQESAVRNLLTLDRELSKKNATPSSLQKDFSRLGFKLLDELKNRYVRAPGWLAALDGLNKGRNGVAHSDTRKMFEAAGGPTLGLRRVQDWDRALRALARACDRVTADSLARLTGGGAPW